MAYLNSYIIHLTNPSREAMPCTELVFNKCLSQWLFFRMINRVIMGTRKIIHNESLCAFHPWSKSNIISPIKPIHGWNRICSYTYCILSTLKDRIYVFHAMQLLHSTFYFSGTTTPAEDGERTWEAAISQFSTQTSPHLRGNPPPPILGEEMQVLKIHQKAFTTLWQKNNELC